MSGPHGFISSGDHARRASPNDGGGGKVQPVGSAYGNRTETDPSTTEVGHSGAIYLLDRMGRARVLVHSNIAAADLANDLRLRLAER